MKLEKMDAFFEARLDGYDQHMLTEIDGASDFYGFTAAQLPAVPGCELLDLGCGTGLELERYFALNPGARVTGIDLSRGMLDALERKFPGKSLRLICGSYFDAPLGEEAFHAAVSVESLHHFTRERKLGLYRRLCQALKPGGYFILTDYFAESDALELEYFENLRQLKVEQGLPDGAFYHYDTPLTVEHEMQVLREAGFSQVDILQNWESTYAVRADK